MGLVSPKSVYFVHTELPQWLPILYSPTCSKARVGQ